MLNIWRMFIGNIHSKTVWGLLIFFALMLELLIIFFATSIKTQSNHTAKLALLNQLDAYEQGIDLRVKAQEQLLLSIRGLYAASKSVERDEFKNFIHSVHLEKHFQGVQAVGFSAWVAPDQLVKYLQEIKAEGFPDASIKPQGAREHYAVIKYIEPFEKKNFSAFGFDMYSDNQRREAMIRSVEENQATLTSPLHLVQDADGNDRDQQISLIMFLPVFKNGSPTETLEQRWQALDGFIYTAIHSRDLLAGIIQQRHLDVNAEITASAPLGTNQILFSSLPSDKQVQRSLYSQHDEIQIYSQPWTIQLVSDPLFDREFSSSLVSVILIFGSLLNASLFLLFYFLAGQSQRAHRIVRSMTKDLQLKNDELNANHVRFNLALESSAMGVWSWDFVDNRIDWDFSMYHLFGLQHTDKLVTHEDFLMHVHPDDRARVFEAMGEAVEKRKGFEFEYRILMPDSSLKYVATRAKIIEQTDSVHLSGAHTVHTMIGTCWDITERKRLDKLKTEFVSTVSHELRTPLTSIIGALGLVMNGVICELPEKAKQVLDIAYKNTQRLKLLINDLLDMDKLLAGKLEFHCETYALMPMIERAVAENKSYADQYKVTYQIDAEKKAWEISVEEVRFMQIMANLLSNAAKFSPPNGAVLVQVREFSAERESNLNDDEINTRNWVRVSVIDQGIGISEENKQHIFEKFYQADSSDTRKKGGTGLGLAISKELAERMGGRIGFESSLGKGSCFWVEFLV